MYSSNDGEEEKDGIQKMKDEEEDFSQLFAMDTDALVCFYIMLVVPHAFVIFTPFSLCGGLCVRHLSCSPRPLSYDREVTTQVEEEQFVNKAVTLIERSDAFSALLSAYFGTGRSRVASVRAVPH